jgi:integrase
MWAREGAMRKSWNELTVSARKAYEKCWKHYCVWCADEGVNPVGASDTELCAFIRVLVERGRLPPTIGQYIAAIEAMMLHRGINEPPTYSRMVEVQIKLARERAAPQVRTFALSREQWLEMMDACGDGLIGKRDRALIAYLWGVPEGRGSAHLLRSNELLWSEGRLVAVRLRGEWKRIEDSYIDVLSRSFIEYLRVAGIGVGGIVFRRTPKGGKATGGPLSSGYISRKVAELAAKIGVTDHSVSAGSLRNGRILDEYDIGAPLEQLMRLGSYRTADAVLRVIR